MCHEDLHGPVENVAVAEDTSDGVDVNEYTLCPDCRAELVEWVEDGDDEGFRPYTTGMTISNSGVDPIDWGSSPRGLRYWAPDTMTADDVVDEIDDLLDEYKRGTGSDFETDLSWNF